MDKLTANHDLSLPRRSGNCSVDWIPPASPDADVSGGGGDPERMRLRHAEEMLDSDPDQFVYAGQVERVKWKALLYIALQGICI